MLAVLLSAGMVFAYSPVGTMAAEESVPVENDASPGAGTDGAGNDASPDAGTDGAGNDSDEDYAANDGYFNIISGQYNSGYFDGARTYFYSDEYFNDAGSKTNPHLRTMSAALAISTFNNGSDDYTTAILGETGFSDAKTYGTNTGDIISATIAHKNVGGEELIAVVIGVVDEGAGWGSNFNVGASGDHQGFAESAKLVQDYLDEYLSEASVTPSKIWAMGYSRGGAAADLFGKYLNQSASTMGINQDNIYVYTFESPHTTTGDVTFTNIHNCVDENDFIPYTVPALWGFSNCGVKEVMNVGSKQLKKKQFDIEKAMLGSGSVAKNDGKASYAAFCNEFMSWLTADRNVTREKYYKTLQENAITLGEMFGAKTDAQREVYADYFKDDFTAALSTGSNKGKLFSALGNALSTEEEDNELAKQTVEDILYEILDADEAQSVFSADEISAAKKAISESVDTLFYTVIEDLISTEDRGNDSTLYKNTVENHKTDKTKNEKADVASNESEEESWQAGYDAGYEKGYDDGMDKAEYDSTPTGLPSDIDSVDVAKRGYLCGYYDAYILAVDFGHVPHVLQKIMTMVENGGDLVERHNPKNAITFIEAQDSYYTNPPHIGTTGTKDASVAASVFGAGNPMLIVVLILVALIAVETTVLVAARRKRNNS